MGREGEVMRPIILFKKVAITFNVGKRSDWFWYVNDEKYDMRYTHYLSVTKVNGKGFSGIAFVFFIFNMSILLLEDNQ